MAGTNRISAAERNENGTKRGSLRASAFMLALLLIFTTVASVVPITLTTVTAAAPQLVAASLDSFKVNGSVRTMPADRTLDATAETINNVGFRGWIGFQGQAMTRIGYKINNGTTTWVSGFITTEQAVINAGGQYARRYEISAIPVSNTTNSVVVVVEVDGQEIAIDQ
ncbi:MAG: hypothetical protein J6V01_07455, partial [Clostridia bacterium]|nr:hypothetical protein [Clostridia bacterium]